ncbi:MAG: ComEC/Rec2 family competence protein [Rhodospirillales bacterium]|nr:ComEC/Rec2 family competence protein [Rhodospirillales bacterium]
MALADPAERERWILLSPLGLILGIALYFALPIEPWALAALPLALVAAALAMMSHRRFWPRAIWCALALVSTGFALAQFETWRAEAPILAGEIGPRMVEGMIQSVEARQTGVRIVLRDPAIPWIDPEAMPERVRISIRTHSVIEPIPGERVQILAILGPPSLPTYPGGFDFAREAFFDRIGGVGYAVGPLEAVETAASGQPGPLVLARTWVEAVRAEATTRILAALPGPENGIAAALLTGQRGAIDRDVLETIRAAGLAHLLAISGLHLGLVTAIIFFVVRAVLAAVEPVALRAPIKTWTALVAFIGALLYLMISGGTVPTQRAFLMTALVLLAVAIGRQAISLRLVALAAIAVMVLSPHVVTSASFQFSFAAVVALVAVYEALRDRWPRWRVSEGPFAQLTLYFGSVLLTTLVASLATSPLVLIHFGRIATFGNLANLIAVPVTAFWVMPLGLLSLLLMPFGLEHLALVPMGWGIEVIVWAAAETTALPGSQITISAAPAWLALLFGTGLVWLAVWRRRVRLLGIVPIAVALVLTVVQRPPDILVADDASLVAVRLGDGETAFSTLRRSGFMRDSWLTMLGQPDAVAWPTSGQALANGRLRCDSLGCLYRPPDRDNVTVAVEHGVAALADDCGVAGFVISLVPIHRDCPSVLGVIDRFDLWRHGTHAIWIDRNAVRIRTVTEDRGERPWASTVSSQ